MGMKQFAFDKKTIEEILRKEYQFVTNLLSMLPKPDSAQRDDSDGENNKVRPKGVHQNGIEKPVKRAKTLTELQARLDGIKKTKKKMSYKDKLLKKGIKNRLKKKSNNDEKNAKQKFVRAAELDAKVKTEDETSQMDTKPVFNSENKLVFSKIDFSNVGKKKAKKVGKDPKKILENLEKQKEKIIKLELDGEKEKAIEIKEKQVWKNALSKAQGEKVKDDPLLLKKSVKKGEQIKRASKKKWDKRIATVEKQKEERQNKRTENIQKRKKDKKLNKLKKAAKKGKIIAGF